MKVDLGYCLIFLNQLIDTVQHLVRWNIDSTRNVATLLKWSVLLAMERHNGKNTCIKVLIAHVNNNIVSSRNFCFVAYKCHKLVTLDIWSCIGHVWMMGLASCFVAGVQGQTELQEINSTCRSMSHHLAFPANSSTLYFYSHAYRHTYPADDVLCHLHMPDTQYNISKQQLICEFHARAKGATASW